MPSKPFRLPLAGAYNTRVQLAQSLGSASGIVGAGIVGIMIVGNAAGASTKDQRFINCYTERVVNPYTNETTLYLVRRPGYAALLTPQAGSIGNDVMVWTGSASKIMSAFGGTNSSIYDGTTRLVTNAADTTAITGKATGITETELSGTATLVISSTDNTGWYYQPAGTVTKITDVDFPGASAVLAGKFAHMDGYAFIMDTRARIWNSDLNSITAWTATSFIQATSYPDAGIGVVRHRDKIMAFGTESVQFFHNAGNATGSPLNRIESMTIKIGCVGYEAIAQVDDATFWAGSSAQGGLAVYMYRDQWQRISTPEIDRILIIAGAGNITLSATKFYGRSFVVVQASTVCFVYCVEENAWHEWTSTVPLWHRQAGLSTGGSQVTYAISKTATTGKVYVINPAQLTFQDDGAAYSWTVQTSRIGDGTHRVFWEEVEIVGEQATSTHNVTISCYDDDYVTATTLGTVDLSAARPRLTRCGSAYRRAYVLTGSANLPLRIEALAGRRTVGAA